MIEHDFNLDCKIKISIIRLEFGLESLNFDNKTLTWIGPSRPYGIDLCKYLVLKVQPLSLFNISENLQEN